MKNRSREVDVYIARSPAFAQPILKKLRQLVHRACPQIEETIKWGVPHFDHKGLVAGMAAFKQHVSFGFWKAKLLGDPHQLFSHSGASFANAIKVKGMAELPADRILLGYIREAVALNENEVKPPARKKKPVRVGEVPADFRAAMKKSPQALATFERFSPSHQREYIEWITEAKQQETRARRLATAIDWLSAGKHRNWKYERK